MRRPATSPNRSKQKENKAPQDDTGVAYAAGRSALFKLNNASYTSAAMADILGRMSGNGVSLDSTATQGWSRRRTGQCRRK